MRIFGWVLKETLLDIWRCLTMRYIPKMRTCYFYGHYDLPVDYLQRNPNLTTTDSNVNVW